jgi:hypothetical protein
MDCKETKIEVWVTSTYFLVEDIGTATLTIYRGESIDDVAIKLIIVNLLKDNLVKFFLLIHQIHVL